MITLKNPRLVAALVAAALIVSGLAFRFAGSVAKQVRSLRMASSIELKMENLDQGQASKPNTEMPAAKQPDPSTPKDFPNERLVVCDPDKVNEFVIVPANDWMSAKRQAVLLHIKPPKQQHCTLTFRVPPGTAPSKAAFHIHDHQSYLIDGVMRRSPDETRIRELDKMDYRHVNGHRGYLWGHDWRDCRSSEGYLENSTVTFRSDERIEVNLYNDSSYERELHLLPLFFLDPEALQ